LDAKNQYDIFIKNNFMKKIFLLSLFTFAFVVMHATIYRVGFKGLPVSGIDFGYNDFGTAQSIASPGDTIQVYQQLFTSSSSYGVYKPLHIMGYGHTLDVNTGHQVQHRTDSSSNWISITFSPGSAGALVEGLNLAQVVIQDSNITVRRCRFKAGKQTSVFNNCASGAPFIYPVPSWERIVINPVPWSGGGNINNCLIDGNYFDSWSTNGNIFVDNWVNAAYANNSLSINNLIVTNNYFNSVVNLSASIPGQVNGVFMNNIVNGKYQHLYNVAYWNGYVCTQGSFYNSSYAMGSTFDGFLIKNNIFNTDDTVTCPLIATNSIIQNNVFSTGITNACVGLGGNNNLYGVDMNTVFSAAWNNGYVLSDNQLALASGSPAAGAGILGNNTPTDCGVYGGETGLGYIKSGMPPVPSIYLLSTPGVNATSNPYQITISVKSNQ
jgi:hypothetical protein